MTEVVGRRGASGRVSGEPGPGAGLSASWTGGVPGRTECPASRSPARRAGAAAGTTRCATSSPGAPGQRSGQPAPA